LKGSNVFSNQDLKDQQGIGIVLGDAAQEVLFHAPITLLQLGQRLFEFDRFRRVPELQAGGEMRAGVVEPARAAGGAGGEKVEMGVVGAESQGRLEASLRFLVVSALQGALGGFYLLFRPEISAAENPDCAQHARQRHK
jgi:hypothetical protein